MPGQTNSLALARLWVALNETKDNINNTILPLGAHVEIDDPELIDALEQTAALIERHFGKFKLVAEPRTS